MLSKRLRYSVLIFLFSIATLFIIKPKIFFNIDNSVKGFGIKSNQSMFTIYHLAFVIAVLAFISL
jgi:hypothetical protein